MLSSRLNSESVQSKLLAGVEYHNTVHGFRVIDVLKRRERHGTVSV